MAGFEKITPEGTKDTLFEECAVQNEIISGLRAVFESRGYREVRTPGFEFFDVFASGDKAEYYPQESMYKLTDARGRLVTVRPDNTIPIARMMASKLKGAPLPVKLYYAQPVFRRQQELSGKSSEIMQMGVELIGASGFESDSLMLSLAAEAVRSATGGLCRVEIGHVGIFNLLIAGLDAGEGDKALIHRYISQKNYAALDDVLDRVGEEAGRGAHVRAAEMLRRLPRLFGGAAALDEAAALMRGYDERLTDMLAYLKKLFDRLCTECDSESVMIDLGLVNQAKYYSSLVFRGYAENTGTPVLSGGRYDDLLSDFGDDLPATGFGLDIDALTASALRGRAGNVDCRVSEGEAQSGAGSGGADVSCGAVSDSVAQGGADSDNEVLCQENFPGGETLESVCASDSAALSGAEPGNAGALQRLRVAVTKGRLEKSFQEMMERAGYDGSPLKDKGRRLLIEIPESNIEIFLAKAPDVVTYVEHGVCDIGIVGKDTIAEQGGTYYEILNLGIGKCKFAVATPSGADFFGGYGTKTIATKYPKIAEKYFNDRGMDVEIIKIEGSVEIAPLLGLADAIVDIVETGDTLRENGLEVIADIRNISARFIVNVTSMKLKKEAVDAFAAQLAACGER